MAFRGSLIKCIEQIGSMLSTGHYIHLTIVKSPTAKYYSIFTDEDLDKRSNPEGPSGHSIIFHGTLKELLQFTRIPQMNLDLPPEKPNNITDITSFHHENET